MCLLITLCCCCEAQEVYFWGGGVDIFHAFYILRYIRLFYFASNLQVCFSFLRNICPHLIHIHSSSRFSTTTECFYSFYAHIRIVDFLYVFMSHWQAPGTLLPLWMMYEADCAPLDTTWLFSGLVLIAFHLLYLLNLDTVKEYN